MKCGQRLEKSAAAAGDDGVTDDSGAGLAGAACVSWKGSSAGGSFASGSVGGSVDGSLGGSVDGSANGCGCADGSGGAGGSVGASGDSDSRAAGRDDSGAGSAGGFSGIAADDWARPFVCGFTDKTTTGGAGRATGVKAGRLTGGAGKG